MTTVYLLRGNEEYEDQYELGIFGTLDEAIEGRRAYRASVHSPASMAFEHHEYVVIEFTLGQLDSGKVVDRFMPSSTKYRKGM